MAALQLKLVNYGYQVHNIGYPSTKLSIEDIVVYLYKRLVELKLESSENIYFVTHSMGGIVLRLYAKNHAIPNLKRAVMISPPNRGSELADFLKGNF